MVLNIFSGQDTWVDEREGQHCREASSGEAAHRAVEQNSSLREDLLRVLYQALSGSGMHLST